VKNLGGAEMAKLKDHTIKNFRVANKGEVKIGGKFICTLTEHPNAELELLVRDGVVAEIRVMRGGETVKIKRLILIRDGKTGALIDSCDNLSRKKLAGLPEDIVVENVFTTGKGQLYLAGDYLVGVEAYPNAPVELHVEHGIATAMRIFRDGKEVYSRTFALALDNATGKPSYSFINMTRAQAKKLSDHTIKGITAAADGKVSFAGETVARFTSHPNEDVELTVEDGIVTSVRVVKGGAAVERKTCARVR